MTQHLSEALTPKPHKSFYHLGEVSFTRHEMYCIDGWLRGREVTEIVSDTGISKQDVIKHLESARVKTSVNDDESFLDRLIDIGYFSSVDFDYEELNPNK